LAFAFAHSIATPPNPPRKQEFANARVIGGVAMRVAKHATNPAPPPPAHPPHVFNFAQLVEIFLKMVVTNILEWFEEVVGVCPSGVVRYLRI
jgi:hypothetical protein